MASTPLKLRCLQRKLYLRSKQAPEKKFYSLYDKLHREDVLATAYAQCRANRGAAGLDGITFAQIESTPGGASCLLKEIQAELRSGMYQPEPVRRVNIPKGKGKTRPLGISTIKDRVVQMACVLVMQPIYEPHFHEDTYGYRPKRCAQGAATAIGKYLQQGYEQVLDADLSGYFDSIPHNELLAKVARRISDSSLLRLLKKIIKAPIAEPTTKGRYRLLPAKVGTPQGAAISPLLALIYLDDFSKMISGKTPCKIVTYADDFVILYKQKYTQAQLRWIEKTLAREGLTLNTEKTHCVDTRKMGSQFNFLGFSFKRVKSHYGKGSYIKIQPSEKSQKKYKEELRNIVKHRTSQTMDVLIARVNRINRGWKNYFSKVGYPREVYFKLDWFVVGRFYRWSQSRSQRGSKYLTQDAWGKLKLAGYQPLQPTKAASM
jgi:group II intron reverse transcriptase/maturase